MRRLQRVLNVGSSVCCGTIAVLGGISLAAWSVYLINANWGIALAVGCFVFPPLLLVVPVMCWFWSAWYFDLALVTWLLAAYVMTSLDEDKESSGIMTPLLSVFVLVLAGAVGYLAWDDYRTPNPISHAEMSRLHDQAGSIVILMMAASGDDAQGRLAAQELLPSVREGLQLLDSLRREEVKSAVDHFVEFYRLFEADMTRYVLGRGPGSENPFQLSKQTVEAGERVPPNLRMAVPEIWSPEAKAAMARNLVRDASDATGSHRRVSEAVEGVLAARWAKISALYQDLFGVQIAQPPG